MLQALSRQSWIW